jgi:hypothetical protein
MCAPSQTLGTTAAIKQGRWGLVCLLVFFYDGGEVSIQ